MNPQKPILVYVEDDENSIFVMKMVTERVMGLKTLYVLPSSADFVKQDGFGIVANRTCSCIVRNYRTAGGSVSDGKGRAVEQLSA